MKEEMPSCDLYRLAPLNLYLIYGGIIVEMDQDLKDRLLPSRASSCQKCLPRSLYDTISVAMGKLPETELVMIAESV